MRQGVNQGDTPGQRVGASTWHLLRWNQCWPVWLTRLVDWFANGIDSRINPPAEPIRPQGMHSTHLIYRLAALQTGSQALWQKA